MHGPGGTVSRGGCAELELWHSEGWCGDQDESGICTLLFSERFLPLN